MNIDTVVILVNRLYNNYNPEISQKIRDDKIKFLNNELKQCESYQFEKAVESIICDENIKKFPTIAQIKNYMPAIFEKAIECCEKCERSGYYTIWQLIYANPEKNYKGYWYRHAYACPCNTNTKHALTYIDPQAIPVRAHNPFPPIDKRHDGFNLRKKGELKNGKT